MGMSEFYGSTDDKESLATLLESYEVGYRHFDTADMYGSGHNEELLGRFVRKLGAKRDEILISTKVGIVRDKGNRFSISVNGSREHIRKSCEESLRRLNIDCIDLYYLHRIDSTVGLDASIDAMKELVQAGKVASIGLCEVSADTIRKANAICKISAVQSEYSLWSREVETEVIPACLELNTAFVGFSPLGRGFLTGKINTDFMKNASAELDFRTKLPRFKEENIEHNGRLVSQLTEIAASLGVDNAQLALAWTLSRFPNIHVIPGTKKIKYLRTNFSAQEIRLDRQLIDHLSDIFHSGAISGARYPQAILSHSNNN